MCGAEKPEKPRELLTNERKEGSSCRRVGGSRKSHACGEKKASSSRGEP